MYAHQVIDALPSKTRFLTEEASKEYLQTCMTFIRQSQKFHMPLVNKEMYDSVLDSKDQLFAGKNGNVRLPYENVWLDYSIDKGLPWGDEGTPDGHSGKVGVLMVEVTEKCFVACVFVHYRDAGWYPVPMSVYVSIDSDLFEHVNEKIMPGVDLERFKGVTSAWIKKVHEYEDDVCHQISDSACFNLVCINTFLKLISCKNIGTEDHAPPLKLNKSRKKKGKVPIFSYKTLVIKPTGVKQQAQAAQGLWNNRIHLCRGHFKEFTKEKPLFGKITGRFWWQPSVRGRNKKGVVVKDYKMEA